MTFHPFACIGGYLIVATALIKKGQHFNGRTVWSEGIIHKRCHFIRVLTPCYYERYQRKAGKRCYLTHWDRDRMADIFHTTFSNAFSWMKMHEFWLRFHWSLFLRVQLTIFQHWFREWLGAGQATSHCLNQWVLIYWRIYAPLDLSELNGMNPGAETRSKLLFLWGYLWFYKGLKLSPFLTSGPFYWHGLTLIPAWISNDMHGNVWDKITYPFLNFNDCTVEV